MKNNINDKFDNFEEEKTCLKILLVSDTHNNKYYLDMLEDKLKLENKKFDIIIHSGDFGNVNNESESKKPTEEDRSNGIKDVKTCLNMLVNYSLNNRVYYILGNHEPEDLFDINCNNKIISDTRFVYLDRLIYETEYNINLIGISGSIPTILLEDNYENTNKDKFISLGYPYTGSSYKEADMLYGNTIKELLVNNKKKELNNQFIFVTHSGPFGLTTFKYQENGSHRMGSYTLLNQLLEEKKLLFSIHGHFHSSQGRISLGNKNKGKFIINPGGIVYGHYAELEITRNSISEDWYLSNTEFYNL